MEHRSRWGPTGLLDSRKNLPPPGQAAEAKAVVGSSSMRSKIFKTPAPATSDDLDDPLASADRLNADRLHRGSQP